MGETKRVRVEGFRRLQIIPVRVCAAPVREGVCLSIIAAGEELLLTLTSDRAREALQQLYLALAPDPATDERCFRLLTNEKGPSSLMTWPEVVGAMWHNGAMSHPKHIKLVRERLDETSGRAIIEELPLPPAS